MATSKNENTDGEHGGGMTEDRKEASGQDRRRIRYGSVHSSNSHFQRPCSEPGSGPSIEDGSEVGYSPFGVGGLCLVSLQISRGKSYTTRLRSVNSWTIWRGKA